MYYVYVLESQKDRKHYIGYTKNLKKRILEHNTTCNKKKYTSNRGPWKLLFYEAFDIKSKAIKYEKFFKIGKGREIYKK